MWKIPKEYGHFAFGIIQSGLTTAIASAIATLPLLKEGTFAPHWLRAFAVSWIVMLPVVVVAAPAVRWLANRITRAT